MNPRFKIFLFTSLFIGLTAFFLIRWMRYKIYILPYEEFRSSESKVIPQFAILNDDLYSQVPLPDGVRETRKSQQTTLDSSHGVYMSLEYLMVDIDPKDVVSYYENFFLTQDWKKYELDSDGLRFVYYRGTSCYEVVMYTDPLENIVNEYNVFIYHDFFEQEFSPKIPSSSVFGFHELGKTDFIRCPPFLDPPN